MRSAASPRPSTRAPIRSFRSPRRPRRSAPSIICGASGATSRAAAVTIFDRSWYGRVLVERVEGFATEADGSAPTRDQPVRGAAGPTRHRPGQVLDAHHRTSSCAASRAPASRYKRWKLTDEDWRNRAKWDAYERAVNDMVARTSTQIAPWTLVEGNDKNFARVAVLRVARGRDRRPCSASRVPRFGAAEARLRSSSRLIMIESCERRRPARVSSCERGVLAVGRRSSRNGQRRSRIS